MTKKTKTTTSKPTTEKATAVHQHTLDGEIVDVKIAITTMTYNKIKQLAKKEKFSIEYTAYRLIVDRLNELNK